MKRPRAIFLDRDGVVNEILFFPELGILETPFHPKHLKLLPRVIQAVRQMNQMGFRAVVVSNQPGIAMGRFSTRMLDRITERMHELLRKGGAYLDSVYYCPHHPTQGRGKYRKNCSCRKPKPGLLRRAQKELGIDLRRSYLIGDSIFDVAAGLKAGCKTILLGRLKCDVCRLMAKRGIKPHWVASDLYEAVSVIKRLERDSKRGGHSG